MASGVRTPLTGKEAQGIERQDWGRTGEGLFFIRLRKRKKANQPERCLTLEAEDSTLSQVKWEWKKQMKTKTLSIKNPPNRRRKRKAVIGWLRAQTWCLGLNPQFCLWDKLLSFSAPQFPLWHMEVITEPMSLGDCQNPIIYYMQVLLIPSCMAKH